MRKVSISILKRVPDLCSYMVKPGFNVMQIHPCLLSPPHNTAPHIPSVGCYRSYGHSVKCRPTRFLYLRVSQEADLSICCSASHPQHTHVHTLVYPRMPSNSYWQHAIRSLHGSWQSRGHTLKRQSQLPWRATSPA